MEEPSAEPQGEFIDAWRKHECFADRRFLTHVSTDKPIYRVGDTIHVRAVILDAFTRNPFQQEQHTLSKGRSLKQLIFFNRPHEPPAPSSSVAHASLRVVAPNGATAVTLQHPDAPEHGSLDFHWTVPAGVVGGQYTLHVEFDEAVGGMPPGKRTVQIRAFQQPKLSIQVKFAEGTKGYAPGERVEVCAEVKRAEGGIPVGASVRWVAKGSDGEVWGSIESEVDLMGETRAEFTVPNTVPTGNGVVTAVVHDGGVVESTSKTIPIIRDTDLKIQLYPEGGFIIPGVVNRVYLEAKNEDDEPIDVQGSLFIIQKNDKTEKKHSDFQTIHEGRAKFEFRCPVNPLDFDFVVRVTKPAGIKRTFELPVTAHSGNFEGVSKDAPGAVLRVHNAARYHAQDPVAVDFITNWQPAQEKLYKFRVAISKREKELSSMNVRFGALVPIAIKEGEADIQEKTLPLQFSLPGDVAGVLRLTVFRTDTTKNLEMPIWERLIFRVPASVLDISVASSRGGDKLSYSPGGSVQLTLSVKDKQTGAPVKNAVLGITVTDTSTLDMVEKRLRAPRLDAMSLIEDEVDHLEDTQTYGILDADDSLTVDRLDLLLGTQGWRTFLYDSFKADPLQKIRGDGDEKSKYERFMALRIAKHPSPPVIMNDMMFAPVKGAPPGGRPVALRAVARAANPMVMRRKFVAQDKGDMEENFMFAAMPVDVPVAMEAAAPMQPMPPPAPIQAMAAPAPPPAMAMAAGSVMDVPLQVPKPDVFDDALVGGFVEEAKMEADFDDDALEKEAIKEEKADDDQAMVEEHKAAAPDLKKAREKKAILGGVVKKFIKHHHTPACPPATPVSYSRIYAHKSEGDKNRERTDFTETVFWTAGIVTDKHGVATASFDLSDAVTRFRVVVDAWAEDVTNGGGIGSGDSYVIESRLPFTVDAKLPVQLSAGDVFNIPITLANLDYNKTAEVNEFSVQASPANLFKELKEKQCRTLDSLKPDSRRREYFKSEVANILSEVVKSTITVSAKGKLTETKRDSVDFHDEVKRSLSINPAGFPIGLDASGILKTKTGDFTWTIELPSDTSLATVSTSFRLLPSPVSQISAALAALIREPTGCFEQASATVYPLVMAQQYFKSHTGTDPKLIEDAHKMLEKGLKKLAGYEVSGGGFDWFGQAPAHEALSAYGLLEFNDMSKVYPVPKELLARTQTFLNSRKNDPGRDFLINPKQLDSFGGAPMPITVAYIMWSLSEAGFADGFEKQVDHLYEQTQTNKDPYFRALVAGLLYNVKRETEARVIAKELVEFQNDAGYVFDAMTSITRSGGQSLLIETTSIAILTWLKEKDSFVTSTRKAMDWLTSSCKGGLYGSTQATVLALKAIIKYDTLYATPATPGKVSLLLNDKVLHTIPYQAGATEPLEFPSIAASLTPGKSQVLKLSIDGDSEMPFSARIKYYSKQPVSDDKCKVQLSCQLDKKEIREGDVTTLEIKIVKKKKVEEVLPMVVAIIGIPGGLEPRYEQLKEMLNAKKFDFYEILNDSELALYWRNMDVPERVLHVDMVGRIPGSYAGRANRAYLYYTNEDVSWAERLRVTITP